MFVFSIFRINTESSAANDVLDIVLDDDFYDSSNCEDDKVEYDSPNLIDMLSETQPSIKLIEVKLCVPLYLKK